MKNLVLIFFLLLSANIQGKELTKLAISESHATSFNTALVSIEPRGYSVYAKWTETTASLVGVIKVQISSDGTNWEDLNSSSQDISGSGSYLWDVGFADYFYIRVAYTRTSGTGTFYIISNEKN